MSETGASPSARLRQLAAEAKGDPWYVGIAGSGPHACNVVAYGGDDVVGVARVPNAARQEYIAAAHPAVILSLLAQVEQLTAERDEAKVEHSNALFSLGNAHAMLRDVQAERDALLANDDAAFKRAVLEMDALALLTRAEKAEQDRDAYRSKCAFVRKELHLLAAEREALRQERDALLLALREYGEHQGSCPVIYTERLCTCGLTQALHSGDESSTPGQTGLKGKPCP